jgi:Tfp pilus assembly protein PilX
MTIKKKKGAALIYVLIIFGVMTILGTTMLNVSIAQTRETSYEDKRIQAYYLARTGADATLEAWRNSSVSGKPSGVANTVYLNINSSDNSRVFETTTSSSTLGKFDVTVTPPSAGSPNTIITSVGNVGNVIQTATVTIKANTTTRDIPPTPSSDAVLGSTLNWYNFKSGQINTNASSHMKAPANKTVKFEAQDLKGIKYPNKNSPAVTFEADKMLFTSEMQILHNNLTLVSNVIAFNSGVDFQAKKDGLALILKIPVGGGVTVGGVKYGIVYFENVGYYFRDGDKLTSDEDINAKLTRIPSGDSNYSNPYLSGSTETITTYSYIWS